MVNRVKTKIKGLILDMDGVLWKGQHTIGNLQEIFSEINSLGLKYIFTTNNSTSTPEQYQQRLKSYGVIVSSSQIINSTLASLEILKSFMPNGGPIYFIGEDSALETLTKAGYKHTNENPKVVLVGLDRFVNYEKLRKATIFIREGVKFIGTNPDKTLPVPEGEIPGAGAILALLEASTNVKPIIAGKPEPLMVKMALSRLALHQDEVLVIGDRYDTDIIGGHAAGCMTAMVLSGVSTRDELKDQNFQPEHVSDTLEELLKLFS